MDCVSEGGLADGGRTHRAQPGVISERRADTHSHTVRAAARQTSGDGLKMHLTAIANAIL